MKERYAKAKMLRLSVVHELPTICTIRPFDGQKQVIVALFRIVMYDRTIHLSFYYFLHYLSSITIKFIEMEMSASATVSGGSLVIRQVNPSDSGKYICTARYDGQEAEAFAVLTVNPRKF